MTATLYKGADAAFPGAPLPAGTSVLAAYIGIPGKGTASPDTPHIWSRADWNSYIGKQPEIRLIPMYVHSYDDGDPQADAANAVDAAEELGWQRGYAGDERRIIVIDAETLTDHAYFLTMGEAIEAAGYQPVMYGSASTLGALPKFKGYFVANYNYSHAPTALAEGILGIQWKPGGPWDLSVFSQAMYDGAGVGPRA